MPSGAILKVVPASFAAAKDLYQALLEEAKGLAIKSDMDMAQVYKDLFCIGFSSKKIEAALWECFKRCTYGGTGADLKVDKDTFEPIEARGDYVQACIEVAKENVLPFVKGLSSGFDLASLMTPGDRK